MSMQPFKGQDRIIIEKRNSSGGLDFSGEQPPPEPMEFDRVYEMFFRADPEGLGTWEQLRAWLNSKGWTIRACTWA